jgi:acyl carrier protein
MTNKEKYDRVFIEAFIIEQDALNENLIYNSIPNWDSVGHMAMIAGVEEAFDIMMETEDIIDFSSYNKGFEILVKYSVEF